MKEPQWRINFRYAIEVARRSADFTLLEQCYQEHCVDGIDLLTQDIYRGQLHEAHAHIAKHFPGSVERQRELERMTRGSMDGV